MSTKVILALLAIVIVIILLLTSQRFSNGIKGRLSGFFPNVKKVEITPTVTPTITPKYTPTPTPISTGNGGINQTPDTGPEALSLFLIPSFGALGYSLRKLTRSLK